MKLAIDASESFFFFVFLKGKEGSSIRGQREAEEMGPPSGSDARTSHQKRTHGAATVAAFTKREHTNDRVVGTMRRFFGRHSGRSWFTSLASVRRFAESAG
jgi:hypothetical protein